ncbi:glutathione S-transferase L3-like [Cornus florida]|uniref:glutathione S-transferase L3-like n=1 Tax=Cornus florida TaxID=4283 RepID=UPI00289958F2|nr:glutathione S-transferase L3-like [Cornus florida]
MASACVQEYLPPSVDPNSEPPTVFDGTTRLYMSYICPYAQRVWVTRNYKGLQDKIKLVPIDLHNKPAWYKEKVYPENKVPALEHNNKIMSESLDLVKYIESHFEGPALLPEDPIKLEFANELLSYTDTCNKAIFSAFKGDAPKEVGATFDYLESALDKFDGPFFLGQFSMVDIAYIPFIERFRLYLLDVWKYDLTLGRPKLTSWIEEMNNVDAYKYTKADPKLLIDHYKHRFLPQ